MSDVNMWGGAFAGPGSTGDPRPWIGRAGWDRRTQAPPSALDDAPWRPRVFSPEALQQRADERESRLTVTYVRRRSLAAQLADVVRRADAMARLEAALARTVA